jgi:truncated hemoglobin YjbI
MSSVSIYEQLGGVPTIDIAVEKFYEKVLSDPDLIEFFQGVSIDGLKKHQKNFFALAMGGPNKYTGKDMRKAHEHLKLSDKHFNLVGKHLADTLTELGASKSQISAILDVVEGTRNDVLNR